MAEASEQGELSRAYGFNPVATQQGLWSTDPIWQANVADNQLNSTETTYHYLHTDHLYTPILATNKEGSITWKAVQEAFGAMNTLNQSRISMNLRFPGQYYDVETGTHYNFHRDYRPNAGRYVQSDPIGLKGGVNTFGYAYQNPINNFDSDGRLVWLLGLGALGGTGATGATAVGASAGLTAAVNLAGMAGTVAIINSLSNNREEEADNSCDEFECTPVEGTKCYTGPDTDHKHGGLNPHYHIYQMFKFDGQCQWKYLGGKVGKGVLGVIPPAMMSCSSYPDFKGRGGRGGRK